MQKRKWIVDTRPLVRSADFRRLWVCGVLSTLGSQMTVVAVLYQVWELTHSAVVMGVLALVQALPRVVCGLVGGVLADLLDRRRVAMASSAGQLVVALLLAAWTWHGTASVAGVACLIAVRSALSSLGGPARRTFIKSTLDGELLPAGVSLNSLAGQVAMLGGPALGGILVSWGGPAVCYAVDAASFAALLWATYMLRWIPSAAGASVADAVSATSPHGQVRQSIMRSAKSLADGLAYMGRTPFLRGSLLVDVVATVGAMPVSLFPIINQDRFGGDPRILGVLLSAVAAGGISASMFSGTVSNSRRLGSLQLYAAAIWGLAIALFAVSSSLSASVALLAIAGAADTVSVISRAITLQQGTPDAYLGRVSSVEQVSGLAGPDLGNFRAGLVAEVSSPEASVLLGGIICIFGVGLVALSHRQLREY